MLPVTPFVNFINQNRLFTVQSKLLAAVSGGMDSVLMAHLLKAAGYQFAIAHCNFQLRGTEADADQEFCRNLAKQLDVEFYTTNFDTANHARFNKLSIQMAARQIRYQWFEQLREQHGFDAITLAHHQNDTIETILLNLTRGTGIAGLHGILPKNGTLVRPMLFMSREEVAEAVADNALPYVEDSSNASVKYARNKLRHEVIPKLKELNPNLENTFERNLKHFTDLEELYRREVEKAKATLFEGDDSTIIISVDQIRALKPMRLLLQGVLEPYGFNDTTVDDLIASLDKHSGRIFESQSHRILLDRDKLILTEIKGDLALFATIGAEDHEVQFGDHRLSVLHDDAPLIIKGNPMATSVDADKLIYPLTLRTWQQSDFFYPLGMKGRQKLSDFFIHQKVPVIQKSNIPLLVNGNNDIIWVAGYRPDDRYKVTDNTEKVTIFEIL